MLGFAVACLIESVSSSAAGERPLLLAQNILQQEEQRRQELQKKSLQDQLKDPHSRVDRARETERAQLLYRHLVMDQGLTHEEAIEALDRAGHPTAGIKRLP